MVETEKKLEMPKPNEQIGILFAISYTLIFLLGATSCMMWMFAIGWMDYTKTSQPIMLIIFSIALIISFALVMFVFKRNTSISVNPQREQ